MDNFCFKPVLPSRFALSALVACCLLASGARSKGDDDDDYSRRRVGSFLTNHIVLPVNQILSPAGLQVELPGEYRPQELALSPNGRLLAVAGNFHNLVIVDPASGAILQRVPLPSDKTLEEPDTVSSRVLSPDKEAQGSFAGLVFSRDGRRVYLSNVNGSVKVFGVDATNHVSGLYSLPVTGTNNAFAKHEIPSGLAISEDGKTLLVALNLSNRLVEMDLATGKPRRFFDCGVAPCQVVLVKGKAFVSNWGGRRPGKSDRTGPAGKGTRVRVDLIRDVASEGSVTVVNLGTGLVENEILVGLHASGLAVSPDKRYVVVANAASDNVSVIEAASDRVVETISMKWRRSDLFGASPNALAFDAKGQTLYVCNGTQNAVAATRFHPGASAITGYIPVGWFPGDIVFDPVRGQIWVANIKGIGSGKNFKTGSAEKYNSHQHRGTLSRVDTPSKAALKEYTAAVFADYRRLFVEASQLPPRSGVSPRPVPERTGEPSLHKHVIYIIKENRTYDQVLGDMKEGNGMTNLCLFGEKVTPNQHKLCRDFVLLDNTHCSGVLSADGHQWADTAFATDYMEKSFVGFPRSYPDGMEEADLDALAYAPTGFIWDNALAHGKTLRDYGEFTLGSVSWADKKRKGSPKFLDCYQDFTNHSGSVVIKCDPSVRSLGPYIMTNTIGWGLQVPDVFRAAQFVKELRDFETAGEMPELIIICLPNDHTSGTAAGSPTPAAQVADNDLAFGQIVEAVSKSRFWKDTCVFAIEDDPQAGVDHVDSYRTTAYVASPYARRHAVVSKNYNHTSLLRTLELMLGLPPMNQLDASATPMRDCFTNVPDFSPFIATPNLVPLDKMNPPPHSITNAVEKKLALASAKLPLDEPDQCPEDLLNRILWAAQMGPNTPYPTWAVTKVAKKPERD